MSKEDLHQIVKKEMDTMRSLFADLQEKVWKSIKDLEVKELQTYFLESGILTKEDRDQIQKATSINDIRNIMSKYWSFLDYDNLKYLVKRKCGPGEISDERKYHAKLKEFCQRNVSEITPGLLIQDTDTRPRNKFHISLDLSDPSLMHIKCVKIAVANILKCNPSKLLLHDVKLGSVLVTFFPIETELDLIPLTPEQQEALVDDYNIVSITYGSRIIFNAESKLFYQIIII